MLVLIAFIVIYVVMYYKNITLKNKQIKHLEAQMKAELVEASVEASEREKQKIARDLHDEINPMISVLKWSLEKRSLSVSKGHNGIENYENDYAIIDKIVDGLRTISQELMPPFILKYGLLKTLEDHLQSVRRNNVLNTNFILEAPGEIESRLSQQEKLNIYRMCLEVIQNIIKHGKSTSLQLKFGLLQKMIAIEIRHNGNGITDEDVEQLIKSGSGLGLKSLRARALVLKANLNYIKRDDHSLVSINIPYNYE